MFVGQSGRRRVFFDGFLYDRLRSDNVRYSARFLPLLQGEREVVRIARKSVLVDFISKSREVCFACGRAHPRQRTAEKRARGRLDDTGPLFGTRQDAERTGRELRNPIRQRDRFPGRIATVELLLLEESSTFFLSELLFGRHRLKREGFPYLFEKSRLAAFARLRIDVHSHAAER